MIRIIDSPYLQRKQLKTLNCITTTKKEADQSLKRIIDVDQILNKLVAGRPNLTHKPWLTHFHIRFQRPLIKLDGLNHFKNFIH